MTSCESATVPLWQWRCRVGNNNTPSLYYGIYQTLCDCESPQRRILVSRAFWTTITAANLRLHAGPPTQVYIELTVAAVQGQHFTSDVCVLCSYCYLCCCCPCIHSFQTCMLLLRLLKLLASSCHQQKDPHQDWYAGCIHCTWLPLLPLLTQTAAS